MSSATSDYATTAYLPLYENGIVVQTLSYIVHEDSVKYPRNPLFVVCDLCEKEIGTTASGNLGAFGQHRGSNTCKKLAKQRRKDTVISGTEHPTGHVFNSSAMPPPPLPSTPPRHRVNPYPVSTTPRPRAATLPTQPIKPGEGRRLFTGLRSPTIVEQGVLSIDDDQRSFTSSGFWSQSSAPRPEQETTMEFFDPPDDDGDSHELDAGKCQGVLVEWKPGAPWQTYPFDLHQRHRLAWDIIGTSILDGRNYVRLLSTKCKFTLATGREIADGTCSSCASVPRLARLEKLQERMEMEVHSEHTPWEYLNHAQIHSILRTVARQNRVLRHKNHSLQCRLQTAQRKLSDHQRILTFVSEYDVPALRRLLAVALRNGASPKVIFTRLEECVKGMYSPLGGFSQRDYDIAFIAKALGGPRLLFALQKAFGLPSATTLSRNEHIPELRPCLSKPTTDDMSNSIDVLFDSGVRATPGTESIKKTGKVLMMDGVAVEEVCRYDRVRNGVLGLCREHSHLVNLQVDDYAAITAIEKALDGGDVHIGKDATVLAIASIADPNDYLPIPILVSTSCKTETGDALANWINLFLDVWRRHPKGEALHGPIQTIASDGESTFRSARFKLAMLEDINTSEGMGHVLSQLKGLNLQTGSFGVLATCDPKHIFKRFATLLRSLSGIQIDDTTVTAVQIVHHLSELPDVSVKDAADLMDPADKQNVPKAVSLIQKLCQVSEEAPTHIKTDTNRSRMISFLAQTLSLFLTPFISVDMSLSDQIQSLSTYAHLTYAMYMKHGLAFMTGALYADSHAVIKNIIFTIARMKEIDSSLIYLLILEGTDRLEMLFSNVRTQDHTRNFDLLQLIQKLSIAAQLVAIFLRQPQLDRGHRRRDLKDAEGVDHINPASVQQGNKTVGDVDLPLQWRLGAERANSMLNEYLGYTYNFAADFNLPRHDMMRPNGETYIGSRWSPDDERSELGHRNAAEEAGIPTADVDDTESSSAADEETQDEVGRFLNGLEDWLQRRESITVMTHSLNVLIDGVEFQKDSIIPSRLRSDRKATIRTLRAAGVTQKDAMRMHGQKFELPKFDTDIEAAIRCGDLVGSLIRCGNRACLGVLEVLHFERAGSKKQVYDVKLDEISSTTTAVCQIVNLTAHATSDDTSETATPVRWSWEKGYISLDEAAKIVSSKHYLLRIPSSRLHLLVPDMHQDPVTASSDTPGHRISYTRSFTHSALADTLQYAWQCFDEESGESLDEVSALPEINPTQGFPYRDSDDVKYFILENGPALLSTTKHDKETPHPCKLCGEEVKLNAMRNHVGRHLLRSLRGVEDHSVSLHGQRIGADACGWCGSDGCRTVLIRKTPKSQLTTASSCSYHYAGMSYMHACKFSTKSPCTNVPMYCTLCSPHQTIWKYNALYHLVTDHSYLDGVHDTLPQLPDKMWIDLHISLVEENALGISSQLTHQWRTENYMPGSDFIEDIKEDLREEINTRGVARQRADTASTSHRPYKAPRMAS